MNRFLGISLFVFLLPLMSGCGDLKSARDVLQERNRGQINQRLEELSPLAGTYEGTSKDHRSQRAIPIELNMIVTGASYDDSGIPEDTAKPTLGGSIYYYYQGSRNGNRLTIEFTSSDYDAKEGRLMLFTEDRSGVLTLDVSELKSGRLTGQWDSASRGRVGDLDLKRRD